LLSSLIDSYHFRHVRSVADSCPRKRVLLLLPHAQVKTVRALTSILKKHSGRHKCAAFVVFLSQFYRWLIKAAKSMWAQILHVCCTPSIQMPQIPVLFVLFPEALCTNGEAKFLESHKSYAVAIHMGSEMIMISTLFYFRESVSGLPIEMWKNLLNSKWKE
jgi:hypothetical protein